MHRAIPVVSRSWFTQSRRLCGPESEPPEIELVARDAQILHDVRNDAARDIAGMPGKGDQAVRAEWVGVMPVAAGVAQVLATNLPESPFQLAAVEGGIFAHGSGGENEFVAKSGRDGASGFQQRFQMRFGSLLKTQGSFAAVAPVRVAAGQQGRFGDPHPVFILTELHFRERNDHCRAIVTRSAAGVKEDV